MGEEVTESSTDEDLVVLVDERRHEQATCTCCLENYLCPGLHQMQHGLKIKEGDSAPLLRYDDSMNSELGGNCLLHPDALQPDLNFCA